MLESHRPGLQRLPGRVGVLSEGLGRARDVAERVPAQKGALSRLPARGPRFADTEMNMFSDLRLEA